MRSRSLTTIAVVLASMAVTGAASADNRCAECHLRQKDVRLRAPAESHAASEHRSDAIGCAGCHGGDADEPTARAHAKETGFVARPARERITIICGGCHGDARFVRRFDARLPVDQLALFGASRHGELVAAGIATAPVCTTCHGTHDIRSVRDPRSPVHPQRIAETCGRCHSSADAMRESSKPTDQVAKWERSVHGAAVHRGDTHAPSCTGCHGSHGEMRAAISSVAGACASCHTEESERVRESPHAKPYRKLGLSECVPCHGTHDVAPARPLLASLGADGSCSTCHTRDSKAAPAIARLSARLREAANRAAAARAEVERAASLGLRVPLATAALADLVTAELRLRPAVHALDEAILDAPLVDLARAAQRVEDLVARAEAERRLARRGYGVAVAVTFALFVLLVWKAVRLARRRSAA